MTAFNSAGGRDYDDNMNPVMNDAVGVRFVEKWIEMVKEVGPSEWTNFTWYDVGNSLGSESAAMIYDADILGFFQNEAGASKASGKIAWAANPPGLDDYATTPNMWIWSLAMNSNSERKGAAWTWLQWATGKDFLTTAAVEHSTVNPVRKSIWENPDFQERLKDFDGYLEQYESLIGGTGIHFTPQSRFFETTTEWAAALHKVYDGAPAKEALDDLVKRLEEGDF
jgi:multiple sugar transport system substrate-binding protein